MFSRLRAHLTALQQEGYQVGRFLTWLLKHPFESKISTKKPLSWTDKAKNITRIAVAAWIATLAGLIFYQNVFLLVMVLFGVWQPGLFLVFGAFALKPYEFWNRRRVVSSTNGFFNTRTDLKIVGITGSFGKTSVKDFLFEIMRTDSEVVKTPESYNTVFGIKKVMEYEITRKTKIFLCEMGAYTRGEIAELCIMAPPDYAVLTAIGTQHLERFGSLENTTLGKFELVDAVDPTKALVNLDNELIEIRINLEKYKDIKTYSIENSNADFYIKSKKLSGGLTSFDLCWENKNYTFTTKLFGSSNLSNLVGAIGMALILKAPYKQIKERVSSILPSPHRLELKKIGSCTLIDDAFSSNEQGFTNIISDLKKLPGKKAIITPGIVELGNKTVEVHKKLGSQMSDVFEDIYLVGKSERTGAIIEGLGPKSAYKIIENDTNLWKIIEKLAADHDWILLENDLTDIY